MNSTHTHHHFPFAELIHPLSCSIYLFLFSITLYLTYILNIDKYSLLFLSTSVSFIMSYICAKRNANIQILHRNKL